MKNSTPQVLHFSKISRLLVRNIQLLMMPDVRQYPDVWNIVNYLVVFCSTFSYFSFCFSCQNLAHIISLGFKFNKRCKNWLLINAPIFNYVIIHELTHLIETNHTPRFWNIIKAQATNTEKAKQWLKENGQVLEEDI